MIWQQLTALSQINSISSLSQEQHVSAVLVFKHSTRCSISAMALSRMETNWKDRDDVPCFYLDLIAHRDVSNALAETFGIPHESPQVLVIRQGVCIYNASHSDIRVNTILDAIAK